MKLPRMKVLDDDEILKIHERSLEILQKTGVRVMLGRMRTLLADAGCQVDEASRIVKFPPAVVEEFAKKAPTEFFVAGADPKVRFRISPESRVWAGLGTAFRMLDVATGEHREATHEDVRKHLVLFDHLDHISCNQMDVWAQDIPMHTIHVETIRTWARNCTKSIGMGAYGVQATRDMMEMVAMVMGGKEALKERHPFCGVVNTHTPLSSAQIQLEGMMILGEHHMPALLSPEAMAGTTAPATLAGLLLQHNAEVLSHVVMSQVAHPGSPVLYGSVSTVADMKTGTPAIGSVETGLISAAAAQLGHHYGLPVRTVAGATEAKVLDVQSGFERMQSMMLAAMGGANYITCVGTLESTNLGAHELAVIDNEIIGRTERALRGIDVTPEKLLLEDIRRVGPEGHYLDEDSTLDYFREEHFIPAVSDRKQLDAWKSSGRKNISDYASEAVDRILAEHEPREIDPKLAEELDAYVEMVKKRSTADFEAAEWEE